MHTLYMLYTNNSCCYNIYKTGCIQMSDIISDEMLENIVREITEEPTWWMPADDFFPDIFPITFQTFRREVPLLILETNVCQDCRREVLTVFLHLARWTHVFSCWRDFCSLLRFPSATDSFFAVTVTPNCVNSAFPWFAFWNGVFSYRDQFFSKWFDRAVFNICNGQFFRACLRVGAPVSFV